MPGQPRPAPPPARTPPRRLRFGVRSPRRRVSAPGRGCWTAATSRAPTVAGRRERLRGRGAPVPRRAGGVAGHGGDVVAGAGQGRAQSAAHETGRAGDEHFHRGHPACLASVTWSPASSWALHRGLALRRRVASARASGARRRGRRAAGGAARGSPVAGGGEDDQVEHVWRRRPTPAPRPWCLPRVEPIRLRLLLSSTMPKTMSAISCSSPGGQASRACGRCPAPERRQALVGPPVQ